jgi:hypothetical protein
MPRSVNIVWRPDQEDIAVMCVDTAAQDGIVTSHGIKHALKTPGGSSWGNSNFIVGIDLCNNSIIVSKEATSSTLSLHSFEHAASKDNIQKGSQKAAQGHPSEGCFLENGAESPCKMDANVILDHDGKTIHIALR